MIRSTQFLALLGTAALLGACTAALDPAFEAVPITAVFETPVMASVGDSADDPSIYIGSAGGGFIAATDKQAGLYIYDLDGSLREFMPIGTVNNVDLRDGFSYKGSDHVLIVASNDETNAIALLLYDPATDTFIRPETSTISTGALSPYGICLGRSVNATYHVGLTSKAGAYEQHVLSESSGVISARKVRSFSTGTKTEGCAFDDRTGQLYIAEEGGGLYRYPASPSGKDAQIVIATNRDYGMKADLEGVTVYEDGADGGYVLVSSQGNNSFAAFSLPDHRFAGRFTLIEGDVDAVTTTDGIAATSTPTARFPKGFLVVQDDRDDTSVSEPERKQNLKIVDWRDIEVALNRPE